MDYVTLVTGGGGYIGTHIVKDLLDNTEDTVVVVDSFERSDAQFINTLKSRYASRLKVHTAGLEDEQAVQEIMRKEGVSDVVHCAAYIDAAESNQPENETLYRKKIFDNTIRLLKAMKASNARRLVFSSSAAVYGMPDANALDKRGRITEEHPLKSDTVYGKYKMACEEEIKKAVKEDALDSAVSFRYFNAAGADPKSLIGEAHLPKETHMLPLAILTALGLREKFTIYGRNHDTRDGTPIRDLIHVADVAVSHRLALGRMREGKLKGLNAYNIGRGEGVTVKEMADLVRKTAEKDFNVELADQPRFPREAGVLCASNEKAAAELDWKPLHTLEEIVRSSLAWHRKLADAGWYGRHGLFSKK